MKLICDIRLDGLVTLGAVCIACALNGNFV